MLSIRTQNRLALVPYNDVITSISYGTKPNLEKVEIITKGGILGIYKTEERAIEILDEIEELFESVSDHYNDTYHMPKE